MNIEDMFKPPELTIEELEISIRNAKSKIEFLHANSAVRRTKINRHKIIIKANDEAVQETTEGLDKLTKHLEELKKKKNTTAQQVGCDA